MVHTLLFVHVHCSCFVRLNIQTIFTQIAKDLILSETKSMEPEYFYRVLKYHWHIFMRTLDPQIIFFLFFLSNIFFYSIQSFLKQDFLAGCICIIGGNKISEPCRERNLWGLGLLVSTSVGQASLERGTGQGNFRGQGEGAACED